MKKLLLIPLLLICLLAGCASSDPAYVEVVDDTPVDVDIAEVSYDDSFDVNIDEVADDVEFKILGRTGNTTYQVPVLDVISHAIVAIDFEHHELHEGNTFTIVEINDLGNVGVWDILLVSPDTKKWAHLVWEVEHELETLIQFYLGTTYSDNGTPMLSFNRNGNSSVNATTLIYHTPTITSVGTLIGTIQQGAGKKAGGSDRQVDEFILKQNCGYLMRITNLTVNDNLIDMRLNWYEHTNKEP